MGDEMKQTETGMPSLTLEPELVMEPEKEIEECIAIARESLESGRALKTLKKFIEINQ